MRGDDCQTVTIFNGRYKNFLSWSTEILPIPGAFLHPKALKRRDGCSYKCTIRILIGNFTLHILENDILLVTVIFCQNPFFSPKNSHNFKRLTNSLVSIFTDFAREIFLYFFLFGRPHLFTLADEQFL